MVKLNHGAGGIDGVDFDEYEKDYRNNLYKLWNRMSSGSYFPKAVRGVEIPKNNGKKRLLGIPTIEDRVAQMVVRLNFEPLVESIFCDNSFGYRPNRSAIDAIGTLRERCWAMPWVLEFDIKGLFDNIDHELLMKAVRKHTDNKWVILYIERFLKAPIMMPDGTIEQRTLGTPQGGVISPVLANLFLHYVFDLWMERKFPNNSWVRFADDGVVNCYTKEEAELVLEKLKARMQECKLEIHPDKTRIVFCSSYQNKGKHEYESFDFLGYTFQRRFIKSRYGNFLNVFTPAVSKKASVHFRGSIKEIRLNNKILSIYELAEKMNPVIRGWFNYFSKFCSCEAREVLKYVNLSLCKWLMRKHKTVKRSIIKAIKLLANIAKSIPNLFYHWQIGVIPTI
jgi:RNA-directed DNA polymerase